MKTKMVRLDSLQFLSIKPAVRGDSSIYHQLNLRLQSGASNSVIGDKESGVQDRSRISDNPPSNEFVFTALKRRRAAIQRDLLWLPLYAHHRWCIKHVKANFLDKFKDRTLAKLMWISCTEHQLHKFTAKMNKMKELSEAAYNWLMRLPLEKWTLCYDQGRRYDITTTNAAEALNSVLKDARQLPIRACVEATFFRLNTIFDRCREGAKTLVMNNMLWPEKVQQKFVEIENSSKGLYVRSFDRAQGIYQVTTGNNHSVRGNPQTVNIHERTCTCGKSYTTCLVLTQ